MDRTSLNISLPEGMKSFIEAKVKSGGYGTASEYIRELIREAQWREAREEIEVKLLQAVQSGRLTEMTKEDWDELRERVAARKPRNGTE
jgi:antitoxin ParD1/3/4